MNPDGRLVRSPSVALAPTDEGYLAYDVERARLHRLNPTAALIMELSDGTRTASQLIRLITPHLASDGSDDCVRWIEFAMTEGLLALVATASRAQHTLSPRDFATKTTELRSDGLVLAAFVCQHYATHLLPSEAGQWSALAELAHIVGRREDARDAYERYLEVEPGDVEVEHILTSLRDAPTPPRAPDHCIVQLHARFAGFYERNMCADLEYQAPAHLAAAIDAVPAIGLDLDVLELGCGTGLAGRYLRGRASRLVGIDLSPDMAALAKATNLYDQLEVAEITEWLTRAAVPRFDLVAACDTLIYFGDLRQVLVPASVRLRPGGWIVFTVERGDGSTFRLTDSGRYVHSESHVRDSARVAGLIVTAVTETVLRCEYGEPVLSLVSVLRRAQVGEGATD